MAAEIVKKNGDMKVPKSEDKRFVPLQPAVPPMPKVKPPKR